jgi:hypothetical protein
LASRCPYAPLHRLPAGEGLNDQTAEGDDLPRERFHAELRGDRRPVTGLAQPRRGRSSGPP